MVPFVLDRCIRLDFTTWLHWHGMIGKHWIQGLSGSLRRARADTMSEWKPTKGE